MFLFLITVAITATANRSAVTIVPVADLLGEPLCAINKIQGTNHTYQTLPLCGKPAGTYACPRIHQLLFNEVVEIVDERGDEVMVKIPNLFFVTTSSDTHYTTYWSHKKNFITTTQLAKRGINLDQIPEPITMNKPANNNTQTIITLTHPYFDPITQQIFSAGTRFVATTVQELPDAFIVFALDPKNIQMHEVQIPRNIALLNAWQFSQEDAIQEFVKVMRSWANPKQGFIPYVWGGCSFVTTAQNSSYTEKNLTHNGKEIGTIWLLEDYDHQPKTGLDCAGLSARAAQLCGIPYFFKNSATAAQFLATIQPKEKISTGDLIWMPLHVMVVSDVKKNTIIEARIYSHGYGKVHEIPLKQAFKGIKTFAELAQAVAEKKPLHRLHADGTIVQTVKACKLLKMASIWDPLKKTM
jgi:cell wall-associated NlpC family hydrolase